MVRVFDRRMGHCKSIHLEEGYDSAEAVIERLKLELKTLNRLGVRVVKIIHSTDENDNVELKKAIRLYMSRLYFSGEIKAVCHGEKFGPFEADGKKIARMFPEFRKDSDWSRRNKHITIAILR